MFRGRPRTQPITVAAILNKLQQLDPKAVFVMEGNLEQHILDIQVGEKPRTVVVKLATGKAGQ